MLTINPEQNVAKIVIKKFQEYRDILLKNKKSLLDIGQYTNFIFRGQSNPYWPLASSYYRLYHKYKSAGIQCPSENQMINAFKRRCPDNFKFVFNSKHKNMDLEILALMQLHGACTRLLDFTYDPYAALYFAARDMNMNPYNPGIFHFAVFAINKKIIRRKIPKLCFDLKKHEEVADKNIYLLNTYPLHSFEPSEEITNTVLRSKQQKPVFIYTGNPLTNMNNRFINEHNWYRLRGNKPALIKNEIWLDLYTYKDLMNQLNIGSCNEALLFPDEDGFCRSLNSFIIT